MLPSGSTAALHQRKYAAPPDVGGANSSLGAQEVKYPTIVNPAIDPVEQARQPSAPSVVSQDWETIDKDEPWDKQVLFPILPSCSDKQARTAQSNGSCIMC